MGRLIQLIYVSNATHPLNQKELLAIHDASIRHNATQEVTGMLLYASGSFMQVLEGEEEAVAETMSRIRANKQHENIYELCSSPLEAREFGTWSMGFRALTPSDAAAWPAYAPFFEQGFEAKNILGTPGLALEMLIAFAEQNAR